MPSQVTREQRKMINQRKALRTAYPDILTLSDITKILKISKRKAAWMLQNGYIKNINSGKKTRQYQVRINDLFEYMDKVERNESSIQIPLGLFNANVMGQKDRTSAKHSETLPCVQKNLKEDFKVWLDNEWADVPEMLTVTDISKISGYAVTTVERWATAQKLKTVRLEGGALISTKVWLIDFYYTDGQNVKIKSLRHIELLEKYWR